jgi:hypothetical protein
MATITNDDFRIAISPRTIAPEISDFRNTKALSRKSSMRLILGTQKFGVSWARGAKGCEDS